MSAEVADLSPESAALLERWPLARAFHLQRDDPALVVGAYKGDVMVLLHELYGARPIGYEPQVWAADIAQKRAGEYGIVHPYALGEKSGMFQMGEFGTDACSFFRTTRESAGAMMEEAVAEFDDKGLRHCALAVINIEGYEFALLPHLLMNNALQPIPKIAIQWHLNLAPEFDRERAQAILADLERTHVCVVDQFPAWTYHERRGA